MKIISIIIPYYKGLEPIQNCIKCIEGSYHNSKKEIDYEMIIVIDSMEDKDLAFEMLNGKSGGCYFTKYWYSKYHW